VVAPGLDVDITEDDTGVPFGLMGDNVSFALLTITAPAHGVSIDERGQSLLTMLSMSKYASVKGPLGSLFDGGLSLTRWLSPGVRAGRRC
jgi:hypothetical protein